MLFPTFVINSKRLKFLSLILFILVANCLVAQNPYAINIDKTSGMPSNSVFDVFQDSKGFMWFATGKGLCRYDGNNFELYTADFQTSKSGSSISEDQFGRIWYTNFDGFLYFVKDGKLQALPQEKALGFYKYGIVKNELFVVQLNGVLVFDLKSLKIKNRISLQKQNIVASFSTKDRFYVLGDYLYEFSDGKNYMKHQLPPHFKEDVKVPIFSFWQDRIFINSKLSKGTYAFKNGVFTKLNFEKAPSFIQNTSIVEGNLWNSTPNGLHQFDKNFSPLNLYFPNDNISGIYKDRQNHYWISTLNRGVLFVQDFSTKFISLPEKPTVLSLGKKDLFVGADKDVVYQLNTQTFDFKKIFENRSNQTINQIYADGIHEKVFFTSKQFNILDKNNAVISNFALAIKDVKKVDDKYFSFAATSVSGIFCVNPKLKSSWDFIYDKNKIASFSGFNQAMLLKDLNGKSTTYLSANNRIYYATNNGLVSVDNTGKSHEIKYQNRPIYLMKIDAYKDFIIGLSTAEKLYKIEKNNRISVVDLPPNLKDEKIFNFRIFDDFCYVFTANSVFQYQIQSKVLKKVLTLNSEIDATDVVLKNKQLFFATSKGIVIKQVDESNTFPQPKLIINTLNANGKWVSGEDLLTLNRDENDIDILFSMLSFVPNEKYNLLYKINNAAWKSLNKEDRNLKLSALSPGKYEVFLAINYNNKKTSVQKISFEIQKAFWQKTYFIIGMMAIFMLLVWSLYRWEINKVKRENLLILDKVNLEKNLNESKLVAIKSQMNPHFFYNALNTIQSFILSNDKKEALSYLSKFSALTRKILEMTEKESISIADEVKTLQLYLDIEKARFEENFEYQISIEQKIDAENTKIPAMLLQPYVENALKHGLLHKKGEKNLEITFAENVESIMIEIIDNGIGREKSGALNSIKNKNHKSFATKAIQNRIDLLNANKIEKISIEIVDILTQNEQVSGTKVTISIPKNFEK